MPNYFQFSGNETQVVDTQVQTSAGFNFYFGCWVRIDPANAGAPLCLANFMLGSTTSSGAGVPMAQLWIQNNQLNACVLNLKTLVTIASVDTQVIADGQWHHVGFFVALFPSYPEVLMTGTRVNFFKNGQPTNETGQGAARQGASATQWPHVAAKDVATATPATGQWYLSLGPATLSNGLNPNPGVKAFNGDMANIVVQTGLLTGPTMLGGYPATDLFNYVAGNYGGVPRVDPMTGAVIALLPSELTTGAKAYCNLATGTPLSLALAPPVAYDSSTFLDGLSEMALYAPSAPFPGSDTGSDPLSLALVYLVQNATHLNLKQKTLAYLRGTAYADLTFDTNAAIGAPTEGGIFGLPYPGGSNFTASQYLSAQQQLQTEMLQVAIGQSYYKAAAGYLTFLQGLDADNLTTINLNISSNEQTPSTSGNIGESVTLLCAILDLAGQPEVGAAIEGVMAVINLCSSDGPAGGAQGPLGAFQGAFAALSGEVATAWNNSNTALGTNMATILCDWGKLSLVDQYNTNGQFNWPIAANTVPNNWATGRQAQFMRQLMTATYQDNYLINSLYRPAPASFVNLSIVPGPFQVTGSASLNGFTRAICTIDTGTMSATSAPSQTTATYVFTTLACPAAEVWYQWWPAMTPIPCNTYT